MHMETEHKVHLLNITSSSTLNIPEIYIFIEACLCWRVLFEIFFKGETGGK